MTESQRTRPGWLRHVPLIGILVVAVIGGITLGDYLSVDTLRDNQEALIAFRDQNFLGLALGFCILYVLIVAFSLPGAAVMSLTGGFLFGLAVGTVLNVASATLGASAIFLAARLGLGSSLSARIDASEGRVQGLKDALRQNEISVLFLLRLVPVVPFFVANLLPALVGVKFRTFLWTTALGIIPGGIVYTWIGVGIGEVLARGDDPDLSLIWEPYVIGPILGLCALAVLPIIIRAVRGKQEA